MKCYFCQNSKRLSPEAEEVLREIYRWFATGKYKPIDKRQLLATVSNLPEMGYIDVEVLNNFVENKCLKI